MVTEILIGSVCLAGVSAFAAVSGYNRMVTLARRCDQAVADVDVQMRHRHDLIPNLVETVRGFAGHERSVIDALMSARSQAVRAASPMERERAEAALTVQLGQALSFIESYPKSEASPHYSELRREIGDVENKIAAARRFQNMAVAEYNASIDQFPMKIIAARCGLRERWSYDLGLERMFVEEAPVVKF